MLGRYAVAQESARLMGTSRPGAAQITDAAGEVRRILSNEEAILDTKKALAGPPVTDMFSSLLAFILLLVICAVGHIAVVFDLQFSRLIYGQATPLFFGVEIASLITLFVLVLVLRSRVALASAPGGFYRNVLDFFALRHWHPSVKLCLAGLLALPAVWFVLCNQWLFRMLSWLGRRALAMSDVQAAFDGGAVAYQVTLIGGLPLLFALHLVCRWKPANRFLPWLLVPVFFVGVFIASVFIVAQRHS